MLRAVIALWLVLGCASGGPSGARRAKAPEADTYIKLVAVRDAFRDTYLLHWYEHEMPLQVHLPQPPDGLFEEPDFIHETVRDAILEWTDVVEPGIPSFEFVERHGDADIPVVWAAEPDGDWYIAFCSYQASTRPPRFGVEQILVTARWPNGRVADEHDLFATVLHEMGHALGLMGHSDDPGDIMYPSISDRLGSGLSERDRATLRELYARGNRQIRGRRGRPN